MSEKMINTRNIKNYIEALDHMKNFFTKLLEEERAKTTEPSDDRMKLTELTDLRALARSDKWPEAVPNNLISANENQRSMSILNTIDSPLKGKKFLDFGCGEGQTVKLAKDIFEAEAYGYDIKNYNWNNDCITSDIEKISNNAPYDVIMLFDVLDHSDQPEEILKKCKSILNEEGKIYVHFHPWFSRSGTHIYRQLNKAYLHLVFNDEELGTLGVIQEKVQRIKDVQDYTTWIKNAGLSVISENTVTQDIDFFFTQKPPILRRIRKNFEDHVFPIHLLEIQFIDMILV